MKNLILTDLEFNQLSYIDEAIKNMKTPEQKLAIELKEKELADLRLEELVKAMKENRQPRTFTLHNRKVIKESELTEEMIDKEVEFGFNL